ARPARTTRQRAAVDASLEDLSLEERQRYEALRRWRAETALEQNIPAYVIFHDATLRSIAEAAPDDLDALVQVPGIGAVKLERYGEDVLQQLLDCEAA